MRIAVFGTGAVGGYFGGRLAQAGESVVFVARGRTLDALREDGLRVFSIAGDFEVKPAEATDQPAQAGAVDYVILGVKAWQVPEAAVAIKPLVGPQTAVLPLLNGVEAHDQLAEVLGEQHVLGGLCRILAFQAHPGVIRHTAIEPLLQFGEWDGSLSERVAALKNVFDLSTGVKVQIPPNIKTAIWEKFLFIAPLSGVGAVTRAPAGILRALPETRTLLEGMMQEILELATTLGVPMRPDIVHKTMAGVDSLPLDGTASMQRDLLEGKPSELEAQLGAVVRLAREAGIVLPLHGVVYASLLPSEKRARNELSF
jgi:2-dehydropantoate 2-reductase